MKSSQNNANSNRTVRTYCAQCFSNCPVVAHIENGRFVRVSPDTEHPFHRPLCPKAFAGPELVASGQRLTHPLKRMASKGAKDPVWERISWEEALDIIVRNMARIKEEHGAEAFVFSQTNVSSPLWELMAFVRRLANLYGTPNHMTTTHICNWHRDNGSALTFGKPGNDFAAGWPDFAHTRCMLIWGHNPANTFNAYHHQIKEALKRKAKLIVVDPRRTKTAAKADSWLQVKPGTDGALALGMINVMLQNGWQDTEFVRNWTNAPLLVRGDTGDLLRAQSLKSAYEDGKSFALVDSSSRKIIPYVPGHKPDFSPELDATIDVLLANGQTVLCKTVFTLLRESVARYTPEYVETVTTIPANQLVETVRMIVANSPASWFSFNGVEQNINATQTNRAICLFYALTGDFDKQGGNHVNSPLPPLAYPFGFEFVSPEMFQKNLALSEHPLGPAGTIMSVPPHLVCKAIEHGVPYPVKGLMVFGANTISANPDSAGIAAALKKLEFHVHIEHFLSPTAELADIVLPSASFWESGRVGYPLAFRENKWVIQWCEPVTEPRGESRDVLWILFELAKRLGFSDNFWNGSLDAGFEAMLQPTGISLEKLKKSPGGVSIQGPLVYQQYRERGFGGTTGRVELYSQLMKDTGHAPLPEWTDPLSVFKKAGIAIENYPFLLITAKLREFCQSQHRALPSLRRRYPEPFLEINQDQARTMDIKEGDMVSLATAHGTIRLEAKPSKEIGPGVVCTQHGWWQACPEIAQSGQDIYADEGANVNRLMSADFTDPLSGSVHMRGVPCNVRKGEN